MDAELKDKIHFSKTLTLSGLNNVSKLFLLDEISKNSKILFITSNEQNALKFQSDLSKLSKDTIFFPSQEVSPYDEVSINPYIYSEQLEILQKKPDFIVSAFKSLEEKFPCPEFIDKNSFEVSLGDEIELQFLSQRLVNLGYRRVATVSDIGEFSIRGDIADIYTYDKTPFRIEFWGDTVTDIRYFKNDTQKSYEKTKNVKILPFYKFLLNDDFKKRINSLKTPELQSNSETFNIKEAFELKKAELGEKYDSEGYFDGIEYYESFLNSELCSILDWFKEYTLVFDEFSEIFSRLELNDENYKKIYDEGIKSGLILPLESFNHFTREELSAKFTRFKTLKFDNFISDSDNLVELQSEPLPVFSSDIDKIREYIRLKIDEGFRVIIATDFENRVREIMPSVTLKAEFYPNFALCGGVSRDFNVVVISDKELFNKRARDIVKRRHALYKESQEFIESINDIEEGEYVVHSIHGVGKYLGLTKQELDGEFKDYLAIEFANSDKLYMPAEQINLLVRYRGSQSIKPKLSKMGGEQWTSTKARVKKEVQDIAQDLLRLYAKRKMSEGISFDPDTIWQLEMEDSFEFTETPDQMKAIIDTKSDMEEEKPMDRLICADVGFGKTEIAIRAIFKAVMSGKQAAIIVPTTILAMQHYETISERFKPFGVKVDFLSRFKSQKEQKNTVESLSKGECDVIIATHRLLQKDISFKDLGLLVIDEEHRFGVAHKEKLKRLKQNIDILTMSATPIPRTLYMSLSGIKDMSLINTPPANRLPVKTFVGEYDENRLKNAINHELERDGQVYLLYNRVETIYEFAARLRELLPNARIAVGHGQLAQKELENVMVDFSRGEFDVLLCTTIIESGLDIPNANTMIIMNSQRFGLAQLYQLRGRVGRSERQAYCYCFFNKNRELTSEARSRLNAIKDFTTLGSGYRIALRDIEIRGVGNILGAKQHGHMVNVGFDTYCNLLEECVKELQGEKTEKIIPSIIDINTTAFIPDEWVGSKEAKMLEYKRLADVSSTDELEIISAEFKDRFSKLPEPVENLIKLIKLRLLASENKIVLVRQVQSTIRIYTPFSKPEWLMIRSKLPNDIAKLITFTNAPKACKDGVSILLLNTGVRMFDEIFNILSDLFYYISKVSHEYLGELKE